MDELIDTPIRLDKTLKENLTFLRNYDTLNDEPIDEPIVGVEEVDLKDWSEDKEVLNSIKHILDDVKKARSNRIAKLEQDWERYRDIYNCRRTTAYYNGRSRLFLPAGKKSVDTLTRIARDAILSDPYLAVETDVPTWAETGGDFMKHMMEHEGKIDQVVPMFLRQLYQIGTSCIKYNFKKECRTIKYRDAKSRKIKDRKLFSHYGPVYTVVDMSHVYVWPETAVDYSGLRIVFEDSTIRLQELKRLAEEGIYKVSVINEVINSLSRQEEDRRDAISQHQKEMGVTTHVPEEVDISYVWAKFQLPDQEYEQWNLIEVSGDNVLRVIENPWWFQEPNYLFGAIFREHDFFYGHGIIESLEMWQYMLNDMANQTMDVGTFTLNPIVSFDPALVDDPDLINIEPGAKVPINPDGIKFERPPAQMSLEGLQMVRFLLNIIQENSDATAIVQGAPREGLGQATGTATGVSQLFAAANAAVLDQVEDLEAQVFTPLARNTEIMLHEFYDEAMVIRTVGPGGVVLTERIIEPTDLVLSTDIRWVASLRLREKFAKAQQALNFLNISAGIDPNLTRSQGFEINYKHLIKMVYVGTGLPDADEVIRDLTTSLPGIPAEWEVELIEAGRLVEASPVDTPENHEEHIRHHLAYMQSAPTQLARVRMQEHISSHFQAVQNLDMQFRQGMAEGGMGNTKTTFPVRPQEQAAGMLEGNAAQGVGSQEGGATGLPGNGMQ